MRCRNVKRIDRGRSIVTMRGQVMRTMTSDDSTMKMFCRSSFTLNGNRESTAHSNWSPSIYARRQVTYGDRGFAVHGPVVWNSLPHDLRSSDISLATFDWKHSCLTLTRSSAFAALANLGYISDIIIIIITIITLCLEKLLTCITGFPATYGKVLVN